MWMPNYSLKPWYDKNYPEAWWPHHVAKCCQAILFCSKDHWNIERFRRRIFLLAPNRTLPLCIFLNFSAFLYISLDFSAFPCISLRFPAFLCIFLNLSAFIYTSLHFFTFLCISLYFSEFICISLHFSEFLRIYLHFSKFICIYMHFTFCILGQFDGVYRCPMDAILEGGLIHFKKDFLCMAARCWGAEHRRRPLGWWEPGRSWSLMLACINPWQHDNHESGLGEVPKL